LLRLKASSRSSWLASQVTTFALAAVAAGSISSAAQAQAQRTSSANAVEHFGSVSISPDGKNLVWIGSSAGERGALMLATNGGKATPKLIAIPEADAGSISAAVWSPDSRQLAVLATSNHGTPALFGLTAAGGGVHRIALVPGAVHGPKFSPDGSHIAFLYSSPSEQSNGPTQATPRDTGMMDTHIDRQHLAIVDVANGQMKVTSKPDLYVYEFDWSPSGKEFVVSSANGSGNNNWWVARLEAIDATTGAVREIAKPTMQIAQPTWSPDGKEIAFIGGLMSDQGSTGGDLYTVAAAGGVARDVTPNIPVSLTSFRWRNTGSVLAAMWSHGASEIATVDAHTGALDKLWSADESITGGRARGLPEISATSDGSAVALVRESLSSAPEIWTGPAGHWTQVTHGNSAVKPSWGKAVSVQWHNEKFNVQGFLIYPMNFDATKRYPMIVVIHGGPSAASGPSFMAESSQQAELSRDGYFVFMPNPRGSYGQGEAFTRANVKDFGHGDLRDIMAGVDTVIAKYPVDSKRLGVTGWSYGGFMTMWTVTQTNRFRAAVAGAGISNWLSYTGENGISAWMVPFFGATAYEDPAVYAKSSPINYISHARTPTLIIVGERDAECPAPQSFEFWRGLQHEGVTTELAVYPDEGHHFANPAHERDMLKRYLAWFDKYLK
jgi:dipeptidyl aminopeptidase/acylaminoacyl peptidase